MKYFAFAKIGKSLKFASAYSPTGGDIDAPNGLIALANNNPDKTFYVISRSDMRRLSDDQYATIFPYANVIDVWADPQFKTFSGDGKDYNDPFYHHIGNYFKHNDINIDACIMFVGQVGTVTIPGKIEQVKDRSLFASVIDMTKNYTTPIAIWLNDYKVPYIEIVNDPRYVMNQSRDIFHLPFRSLGQFDWRYPVSPIKSYEDQDRIEPPIMKESTYDGMETLFLINREFPKTDYSNKTDLFNIILNEGAPSRYNMLNEWVLKNFEDVAIYGKWEHEYAQHEMDTRFKGSVQLEETQKIMSRTKYTFIIPIKDGWVTSKYIEMIQAGVIPFLHPSYDGQGHLDIPKLLRPKNSKAMLDTISKLESDPKYYKALIELLQQTFLKPEYYDGSFFSTKVMGEIYKEFDLEYVKPDLSKYKKTEVISLEDFF